MVSQQCDRKRHFCHSGESSPGPPSLLKGESQWFAVSQRICNYFCGDKTSCDSGQNMKRQVRSGAHWCVAAASHREISSCRAPDSRGHLLPQRRRSLPRTQKAHGDSADCHAPPNPAPCQVGAEPNTSLDFSHFTLSAAQGDTPVTVLLLQGKELRLRDIVSDPTALSWGLCS